MKGVVEEALHMRLCWRGVMNEGKLKRWYEWG